MIVPFGHVLVVATAMFVTGLAAVLLRRNLILILIGVEVMLGGVGLALVGASALWQRADGQVLAVLLMALSAAEVAISLAMVVYMKRRKDSLDADAFRELRG